jgi:hypothetical protein
VDTREHLSGWSRCSAIVARVSASDASVEYAAVTPPGSRARHGTRRCWTFGAPTSDEYVVVRVLDADVTELLIIPRLMQTA